MSSIGANTAKPSGSEARVTFRKSERLCSQTAIGKLIREGKTINQYPFRLTFLLSPVVGISSPAQLAIAVPKRNFKRAVKRNLIKRRIRESYRLNKALLYNTLEVKNISVTLLLVYVPTEILPYNEIEQKLTTLLQRLVKRAEESVSIPANSAG